MLLIDLGNPGIMHRTLHVQRLDAMLDRLDDAARDVPDLTLGMKDRTAAMTQVGVRPVQDEQIRKVRYRDPEVSARIVVSPSLG